MLTKFKVSNFKSFNKDFIFDLSETNGYTFNSECIKNGIVNNALVYGHNGVGKSNLALAIFDIIEHLTDRTNKSSTEYLVYLNAYNNSETAHFYYEFLINSCKVVYEYKKTDHKTIIYEKFTINDEEFAFLDRKKKNSAIIKFKGAENLKNKLTNDNLSLLKYIKNNTELDKNKANEIFNLFFKFVEGMLYFRSLQSNFYLGIEVGKQGVIEDIIEKKYTEDLEFFLNKAGIECKLKVIDVNDKKTLAFNFNGKTIPFFSIASQGTKALVMFYFWFKRIQEKSKVSFLFIDEFDAFYHHELSALIVEELKKTGVQFVLTTHNTSIITNDLLRPDCYFLMNKESILSLAKSTPKELREAHNIEKMYKAGSFNVK
ncbi:AAA family ATPase [Flavobacterium chungangensis]|uniref:ATP/GTP-binding protein n=1 Tax=Flavobacterium chungangensis TaxID=2708132 RepID=A0ABV8ZDD7_9FLAO